MKTIVTFLAALAACMPVTAQQRFVSFDDGVPANWQTNSATPLCTSATHVKAGKALLWQAAAGNQLAATGLGIPANALDSAGSAQAQIFLFVPQASEDTLLFQFFDDLGDLKREGKLVLNFNGWREFHRSYYYDYNNNGSLPGFNLAEMRITFVPKNPSNTCTLYIDEARLIGDANVRVPALPVWQDYPHFRKHVTNAPYLNVLENWKAGPDLPVTTASAQELADLAELRNRFLRTSTPPPADSLLMARNFVTACQIVEQPDGTLSGTGIPGIYTPATMVQLSAYVGLLARAVIHQADSDAAAKLVLFTRYLLSEGMAEGGRIVLQTNSYTYPRTFPVGFLQALPLYTADLRAQVLDMLKWANEYSVIYGATYTEGYSVDFLNLRIAFLFELALANPDDNTAVRDVKMAKRFLERNTVPGIGGRDGMKPDGVGYHHGAQHTSYMGAWAKWVEVAAKLKGTVYRVSPQAYDNLSIGMKYLLAASSQGVLYAHAESGRNPFPDRLPVKLAEFEEFVRIGGDAKGVPADPAMGAFYNAVTGTNVFDVPPASADGFYQFNYGALGVQRKRNWVAVMRGYTSKIFSAEIYRTENRFGRYQSYGTLEVLYGGTLAATGYIFNGRGWDWNVMPGTTTVHFPDFLGLQPTRTTAMEFQNNNLAGSLSLGQHGIFALNLDERANGNYGPSRLKAKKSVFAFDTLLVCLGSSINAQDGRGNVATNLFQAINKTANPDIYVNSATPLATQPYDQTFDTQAADLWLLNAQTTGYYIPQGNGTVRVVRGQQSTPKESVPDQSLPNSFETAYASKAWINHGLNPANAAYHYVAVPGTTPAAMQALGGQLAGGAVYSILKQTDSMHIVRYHPAALTGYVFFKANTAVNTAHVKSVSAVCVAGIAENGDELTVTVNGPDMNIQTGTAFNYYWRSLPRTVTLVLNGDWDVAENLPGAVITHQAATVTLTFTLTDGFAQTVKLKVPAAARQPEALAYAAPAEEAKTFRISPNPAAHQLTVRFTTTYNGPAQVRIFNMQGAMLRSQQVTVQKGRNLHTLDITGLAAGSYVLAVEGSGLQERGLFIKQ